MEPHIRPKDPLSSQVLRQSGKHQKVNTDIHWATWVAHLHHQPQACSLSLSAVFVGGAGACICHFGSQIISSPDPSLKPHLCQFLPAEVECWLRSRRTVRSNPHFFWRCTEVPSGYFKAGGQATRDPTCVQVNGNMLQRRWWRSDVGFCSLFNLRKSWISHVWLELTRI